MNAELAPGRVTAGRVLSRPARLRVSASAGVGLLLVTLTGCQSMTGSAPTAQIRVIDASADAGELDVYQGPTILAYNLNLGTITSYIPAAPGKFIVNVERAGTRTHLAQQSGTFPPETHSTILIGNSLASLRGTVLQDQNQPAPPGQTSLRFIDQSARPGAVDVYLIPSGSTLPQVRPMLNGVVFGQNTGYLTFPAGTYTLAVVPFGTEPTAKTVTLYTGAVTPYASGSARTIVLIDQGDDSVPGLQVIVAEDYDPTQG